MEEKKFSVHVRRRSAQRGRSSEKMKKAGKVLALAGLVHFGGTGAAAAYPFIMQRTTSFLNGKQRANENVDPFVNDPGKKTDVSERGVRQILKMYRGSMDRVLMKDICADDVVFEDPLVVALGKEEFLGTFAALPLLRPVQLNHKATYREREASIKLVQQYTVFGLFTATIDSTLVVKWNDANKIANVSEYWKSHPQFLIGSWPFRRINGWIGARLVRV